MSKTLIYDSSVSGHHLEYLHHFYERALELASRERQFVFAVPESFVERSQKLLWQKNENISFVYFAVPAKTGARWDSQNLSRLVREQGATDVLLSALMSFLPWLPFMLPRGVKVSGIVYMIYLYRWKKSGLKTKILDVLKYLLFRFSPCIGRVFLLNDKVVPRYLNKLYRTQKFAFLPDPVAIDAQSPAGEVRTELGVPAGARLFSHFGGLDTRKGTLDILEAVCAFPQVFRDDYFVFAGRVGKGLRERFYALLETARAKGAHIIVKDEFVAYEFLKNLAASSTAILIPYHNTEQSSGLIAYAAATGVPVIAPRGGLLGKLVKRYRLGLFIEDLQAQKVLTAPAGTAARALAIASALAALDAGTVKRAKTLIRGNDYLRDNSLEEFQKIAIEEF
ncbi:MAG: glycosyltransferase [Opitutales bacterium]|nr:glycosyltransferase [Opitutales bacterium]